MSRTKEWIGDIPSHNPFWDTIFQKKILYLKSGYNLAMQASKRVTIFPVLKNRFALLCRLMVFQLRHDYFSIFIFIYFITNANSWPWRYLTKSPPPKKTCTHIHLHTTDQCSYPYTAFYCCQHGTDDKRHYTWIHVHTCLRSMGTLLILKSVAVKIVTSIATPTYHLASS